MRRSWTRVDLLWLGGILVFALVPFAVATGGYADGDDRYYLQAAHGWLEAAPFVGTVHWHMRHPLVLALAASLRVFGDTETAMMVPSMLAYFGLVGLVFALAGRIGDRLDAALAAALVAAAPVFAIYAKVAYPDLPEATLCLLSFWLFWTAERAPRGRLLLAGLVLGVCFTMRASCMPLAMLFGGLMLLGFRWPRRVYAWLWLGFAAPITLDFAYVTIMTGDPLYRMKIDAASLEVPSQHMIGQVAGGLRPPFNWQLMAKWLPNSYVDVHWALNPFIDLLSNLQYGFVCLIGLLAARSLLRRWPREQEAGLLLRVLMAWAVLTVFVVLFVLNLRPQPRYFTTTAGLCCIFSGLLLADVVRRHRTLGVAAVAVLLALDLGAGWARPDPVYAERWLVRYAASSPEPVWTTPERAARAAFLLHEHGLQDRVHAADRGAVPPGVHYVVSGTDERPPDWPVVWTTAGSHAGSVGAWLPAPLRAGLDRVSAKLYPAVFVLQTPLRPPAPPAVSQVTRQP